MRAIEYCHSECESGSGAARSVLLAMRLIGHLFSQINIRQIVRRWGMLSDCRQYLEAMGAIKMQDFSMVSGSVQVVDDKEES
jgi:hypothetical protein